MDLLVAAFLVLNVPELEDALRDEKRRYEQIHQNDPDHPFKGLINVQADRKIPFKVIKRVMFACNQSGFGNINFAALSREGSTTKTITASNN